MKHTFEIECKCSHTIKKLTEDMERQRSYHAGSIAKLYEDMEKFKSEWPIFNSFRKWLITKGYLKDVGENK